MRKSSARCLQVVVAVAALTLPGDLLSATGQQSAQQSTIAPIRQNRKQVTPAAGVLAPLSCSIAASKSRYTMGETPQIQVRLKNERNSVVYLVGSLDGSESAMRFPYCFFEIKDAQGKAMHPQVLRCGNTNPLRLADFVRVKPKAHFDPYMKNEEGGFFGSHLLSLGKKTFPKPGQYKVRFYYSTQSQKIEDWLGDGRLGQDRGRDLKLIELFRKVPKSSVQSNELTLTLVR